jgi:4-amino-4-deoxy-L-arabinose transferase-like glycosyltransferase
MLSKLENTKFWFIVLIVMIALNIWSLKKSPPVGMDDTLESAIAHNLIENGRFALTMYRNLVRYGESALILGRLHLGGLALTGSIFGPSITSDRLWPLCMGFVALYLLWQLAKSCLGSYWGVVAVTLCLTEPMFFSFSHIPRPEMTTAVFFLLAILCGMQVVVKKSRLWFFLAGLLGTLAIDAHLPGIILAPSIAIALISLKKGKVLFLPNLLWFGIGAFIGSSWYLATHVFANPKLFALQWDFHLYYDRIIGTNFCSFLAQILKEYVRYYQWFWGTGPQKVRLLEGFLIIFGLIIQLRSRHSTNRYLGIVSLSSVIVMGLIVNRKAVYYLLPLYPLFVLSATAGLRFLIAMGRPIFLRKRSKSLAEVSRVTGSLLAGLFIFYFVQDVRKLYKYRHVDYERYLCEISYCTFRSLSCWFTLLMVRPW